MWCLILVLCIIIILLGLITKDKETSEILVCIGLMVFVTISFISTFCLTEVINARDIEKQIAMYKEENQVIEQQINTLVENYMTYEGQTFKEFAPEDSMALVSLYPELKSDQLVMRQMDVYTENNKQIKCLKEKLIDVNSTKWWLYFGGN